jgi:hypothetical protein
LNEQLYWDNANGQFVFTDDVNIQGNLTVTGTVNGVNLATVGANSHTQNTDTGTDATTFEINTGGNSATLSTAGLTADRIITFDDADTKVVGENNTQTLTNKTLDGDDNTFQDIPLSALKDRNRTILLKPEYPKMTLAEDGTDNQATIKQNFDPISGKIFYYLRSNKNSLQDLDFYIAVQVPDDFQSFQAIPLQINFKSTTTNAADNHLDIELLDTVNSPVSLNFATDLVGAVADTWEVRDITFNGVPTFTPGEYMVLKIKAQAKDMNRIFLSEINFNYIGK